MLKQMILVLVFKEKLEELYQEAIAVGVCSELQSTRRS
jgi:hypothetical protein